MKDKLKRAKTHWRLLQYTVRDNGGLYLGFSSRDGDWIFQEFFKIRQNLLEGLGWMKEKENKNWDLDCLCTYSSGQMQIYQVRASFGNCRIVWKKGGRRECSHQHTDDFGGHNDLGAMCRSHLSPLCYFSEFFFIYLIDLIHLLIDLIH